MTNVASPPRIPSTGSDDGSRPVTVHDDARVRAFVDLFDHVEDTTEPNWLRTIRRRSIERLGTLGFPTTKNEDWHFTSVAPITQHEFTVANTTVAPTAIDPALIQPYLFDGEWDQFVFLNGVLVPSASSAFVNSDAYVIAPFSSAITTHAELIEQRLCTITDYATNGFTALNSAFMQDGIFIYVKPNTKVERPIHLVYLTDDSASGQLISPRHLMIVEHHAELTVLKSYGTTTKNTGPYFTNVVSEAFLGDGARVREYKIQREHESTGYHVSSVFAHQERDSNYESFSYAVGAHLSRTNISTVLDGEGSHVTMNGLYLVDGKQTVDHQTYIEHAKENCTSHEVYKGVLDGNSHAVFNGKVYVHPEAQKTDGKQSNNNLLLSERARIDTKPQLEIFADDVRCTHGATIGRLDETALFYLKSRGVNADTARKLLTYAFAADVLEELTIESVRDRLEALVFERFTVASNKTAVPHTPQ